VAARPEASVCSHSLAGTVGSNPVGDTDICLSCVLLFLLGGGLCMGPNVCVWQCDDVQL
jgi:hypothetical protein